MLIHGYNHHYEKFQKNPFQGEGLLVFANGGGPEGDSGQGSENENKATTPESLKQAADPDRIKALERVDSILTRDLKEFLPGETPYTPKRKEEIEWNWEQVIMEYNGTQGYIDHFIGLKSQLERMSPGTFQEDIKNDHRWGASFQTIQQSLEDISSLPGINLSAKTQKRLSGAFLEKRDNFIQALRSLITELVLIREKTADKLEKQMQVDFMSRLDWLDAQLDPNKPRPGQTRDTTINNKARIQQMRHQLRNTMPQLKKQFPNSNERIREYFSTYEDIKKYENQLLNETPDSDYEYSHTALVSEFGTLEAAVQARKEELQSGYAEAANEANAEIDKLIAAFRDIPISEDYSESDRAQRIEELEKKKQQIEQGKDFGGLLDELLYGAGEFLDENDNPIHYSLGGHPILVDGKPLTMKKGLKAQIEDLQKMEPHLSEEEKKKLASGMHESLQKIYAEMEEFNRYKKEMLPIIAEKARQNVTLIKQDSTGIGRRSVKFLAARDLVKAFEIISEWAGRRYQRSASERVGIFGSAALGPLGKAPWPLSPLRTLPNEFDRAVESAEQEEVNKYKEIYSNKDMWQIEEIAYNTKNKDEFKACLYLLAEGGRIRWEKPQLLKQLNKFQDNTVLLDGADDVAANLGNPAKFEDDLNRAMGHIWDFDTYRDLKSKNSSAYNSKKSEFEQDCHTWAETVGLSNMCNFMLQNYVMYGEKAKVDPILYEQIIDYSIVYGKMGPHDNLYFLVQGIARGLLAPDRASVLNSLRINDFPAIDFFGSETERGKKPTLADIEEVAALDKEEFIEWFHVKAMTLPRVTQRITKTLTQGNKLDHDDLTAFLGYMDDETTKSMLRQQTTGYLLPATGVANGSVGMMFMADHLAENWGKLPKQGEKDISASELVRWVSSFAYYDGIICNRYQRGAQNWYRMDENARKTSEPRMNGYFGALYGRGGGLSVEDNLSKVRSFLRLLDEDFFGVLFDQNATSQQVQATVAKMQEKYGDKVFGSTPASSIQTIDQMFEVTGAFVQYLVSNEPAKVNSMVNAIKQDHASAYQSFKSKRSEQKKALELQEIQSQRAALYSGGDYTPSKNANDNSGFNGNDPLEGKLAIAA